MISKNDIEILRELSQKYMSYAVLPIQETTRKLWYSLNSLNMQKPMITIDQMPWNELCEESLICKVSDPYWREVENTLRQTIYKWEHLRVDMVLQPYICLPLPLSSTKNFGLDYDVETRGEYDSVKAQSYTDILENEQDIEKIKLEKIVLDYSAKNKIAEEAEKIFDGICEYRWQGVIMHLGLWDWIAQAKNVTNCYLDIMDRPEFIHTVMQRLTDCVIDAINQYNSLEAFDSASAICHCSHTFSYDLPTGTNGTTSKNTWAFGMAQLFSSTSPEITKEFEVPYMKRIFQHFGAIYYGCCERLDDRLDILDMMPNIRKVSCSPWSEREKFAEMLPKKYIMSNKPSPAFLASNSFDEEAVRKDLRRTMQLSKANGLCLEMLLKDISTVRNDPSRLWRWAEIASEEAAAF